MKSAYIRVRIDPKLKKEAEDVFKAVGLTISQAIQLFYQQSINCKGLPFHVTTKCEDSNNKDNNNVRQDNMGNQTNPS